MGTSRSDMSATVKLILFSLLLTGVAVASPTKERAKRYAQEQEGSSERNVGTSSSPLEGLLNRVRGRLEDRQSAAAGRYPLRDWLSNIGQQRNGSMLLDQLLRRMNETWSRRFSGSNTAVPSRNIQLLRELFQIRNTSSAEVRERIDAQLRRFFSDLNQRLSSRMNVSLQTLRELRELIRQRMELHLSEDRQELQRLLHTIHSIISERSGTISSGGPQTSGGGSVSGGSTEHSGGASTSGSGSASGSAESGGASSGSAETPNS